MAKKRKTPPSPRSPFDEPTRTRTGRSARLDSVAAPMVAPERPDRDTDEDFAPVVVADAGDGFELAGLTVTDLPALGRLASDDELLDLGELGGLGGLGGDAAAAAALGHDVYAELSTGEPTQAGGKADGHVVERRLTATLLKVFARRRKQIALGLDQLARLSGISSRQLQAFEEAAPGQTITYDQVVVLARVLGVPPEDLPGLRRRDVRGHLGVTLAELERTLLAAPLLRFEGKHGERYGGDVERAAAAKAFTVLVEDDSLSPVLPRGAVLGFMSGVRPRAGGILLLRHRRSSMLAIRRYEPPAYAGLQPWQPSYVVGGEWHVSGSLEVMLPPR